MCPQQLDHKDARIHCAILNKHTTPRHHDHNMHAQRRSYAIRREIVNAVPEKTTPEHSRVHSCSLRTQQDVLSFDAEPTSRTKPHVPTTPKGSCTSRSSAVADRRLTSVSAIEHPTPTFAGRGLLTDFRRKVLLRKEVIQPHLPVRLPCYDFVPIASPPFDGSLHKGWATGFGCCRLS